MTSGLDLSIRFSGSGGDGSLTVANILADMMRVRGRYVHTARDVRSRIRGGPATGLMRVADRPRHRIGDRCDVLVAMDAVAVSNSAESLTETPTVFFDSSSDSLPAKALPGSASVYAAAFGRLAVRHLGRELFRNTMMLALLARALGIDDDSAVAAVAGRYARKPELLEANVHALRIGFDLAVELGVQSGAVCDVGRGDAADELLLSGNDAVALGFVVGGGRFYAGYPITPASEVMDRLAVWLPPLGGVAQQCEDELAAVNMALGAALTGARAMVATSGPGLSLVQEGVSQAGMAELPLVVVDCQRAGASTGMPTKPEQSDLDLMIHGGHGDFPRIVLAPSGVTDCFYLTATALNLAARYQCPVYLALDQALAQDRSTVAPFDPARVVIDEGERITPEEAAEASSYLRYQFTPSGISAFAAPGTPGAVALVTGNEHDQAGQVSTDPAIRTAMVEKRLRKLDRAGSRLPPGATGGDPGAGIGFIGVGFASAVIAEAVERLGEMGIPCRYLFPQTLWPVPKETMGFIAECTRVYVVEHNATGQIHRMLRAAGAPSEGLVGVLKYDGHPFTVDEVVARVVETGVVAS